MKTLRRYNLEGAHYFITCVSYQRRQILLNDPQLFHACWTPIKPIAWAILPDHFHAILIPGDNSISDIMHAFKTTYSRRYRDKYGPGRIWQNRFWDHVIRDQEDFNRHLDYIHYNPVKHGLERSAGDYAHSSFVKWRDGGFYESNWGESEISFNGNFGE